MKRWVAIAIVMFTFRIISAQGNLVPNPSFELHTSCPNGSATVNYAAPWIQYNTADYFDTCATHPYYDVPYNWFGYQPALMGGAYCGLVTFFQPLNPCLNLREYIQVQLLDTLKPNIQYCIAFYVSIADTSRYSCSSIGVHFSSEPISPITWTGSHYVINYSAHAENDEQQNPINDTANWLEIKLEYVAVGGEDYITIGNFKSDSISVWQDLQNGSTEPYTYIFIDAISVYQIANSSCRNDSLICMNDSLTLSSIVYSSVAYSWFPSTGLSDSTSAAPWAKPSVTTTYYLTISDTGNLYCTGNLVDSVTITVQDCTPIPPLSVPTLLKGDDLFYITSLPMNSSLKIFDTRGRLVLREENYQNDFSVVNLDASVYLYELMLPDLTLQKGKFCVVK